MSRGKCPAPTLQAINISRMTIFILFYFVADDRKHLQEYEAEVQKLKIKVNFVFITRLWVQSLFIWAICNCLLYCLLPKTTANVVNIYRRRCISRDRSEILNICKAQVYSS